MICLLVELSGYRQLVRLQPELVKSVRGDVRRLLLERGAVESLGEDGHTLFCVDTSAGAELDPFIEGIFDVLELLRSRTESLAGFNLIVDMVETNDSTATLADLRRALRATSRDNELWVGNNALGTLRNYLRFETTGTSRRVTGRRDQATSRLGSFDDFVADDRAVEQFLSAVDDWLVGNERPGTLLIAAEDTASALAGVRKAIGKIYGPGATIIELHPSGDESPLDSLIHALAGRRSIGENEVMNASELAVWNSQESFLRDRLRVPGGTRLGDHADADIWQGCGTAFSSRIRSAAARRVLPAILFAPAEELDSRLLSGMSRLLADLPKESETLRVVIHGPNAEEALSPFLLAAPLRRLRFEGLDLDTFASRADLFLSDSAKRKVRLSQGLRDTLGRPTAAFYHFLVLQDPRDLGLNTRPDDLKVPSDYRDASQILTSLAPETKEHLWAFFLCDGRLSVELMIETLEGIGYNRHRLSASIESLRRLGFLEARDFPKTRLGPLASVLKRQIRPESVALEKRLAGRLAEEALRGGLAPTPQLLPMLLQGGEIAEQLRFFCELVNRLIEVKDLGTAERLIYKRVPLTKAARQSGLFHDLEAVLYSARLRLALARQDWKAATALWNSRQQLSASGFYRGLVSLQLGRYALSQRQTTDAENYVKRAMVDLQEEDSNWTNSASIDFGGVLLARHKLSDAREYFVMARQRNPTHRTTYNYLRSIFMESIALFLRGSLSQVLTYADQLIEATEEQGMRSWNVFARFLNARVLIELGQYAEGRHLLEGSLSIGRIYGLEDALTVIRSWIARAHTLQGHHSEALAILSDLPESPERDFFLADLLFLSGNHSQSLELLDRVLLTVRTDAPVSPDVVDWSSGFASLEDRVFGLSQGEPVLYWLARSLRGLVLHQTGDTAEAIADLRDLTRSPIISPDDPYNSRYFYIYGRVLPEQRSPEVDDFLTVLGKAVKYFQERNSRIDIYQQKISFMRRNVWNSELIETAREHNLL
jgi:tetratricopeptide (TPR) repeat protein